MKDLEALKTDNALSVQTSIINQFTNFMQSPILESEHYCFVCGMSAKISLKKTGYSNIIDPDSRMAKFSGYHACPYPKGLDDYSHVLKVPSGVLVLPMISVVFS